VLSDQPASGAFRFEAMLPFEPTVAHHGRTLLHEHLGLSLSAAAVLDLELVLAELLTNAFVFGAAPVTLRMAGNAERIRIEVHDGSSSLPRLTGPTLQGGLGLRIVAQLADRWGADPAAGGKVVWAELRPADAEAG
jgi:two-component sensor histidine kinase